MTKWHTHLHVAGFAGENNYRLLSGSRFLGLCDSGSWVHSLFHTKHHNLKKKIQLLQQKWMFHFQKKERKCSTCGLQNNCILNVQTICEWTWDFLKWWFFFYGTYGALDPPPFSGDPVTFRVGQTLWVCSTKWCSSTVLRSSLTFSFLP